MRVISGKYRGKRIISPRDDSVRPTTDKIKETIFNILQFDIPDAKVLDLFAGTGALGIECISRGAEEVVFVDKSRDSLALVRENLKGIEGNYSVVAADFLTALKTCRKKFDIILLDPPFGSGLGEIALNAIFELDILAKNGIIMYEHGSDKKYMLANPAYKQRTKPMGGITVEIITHKTVAIMAGSYDPITKGHEAVLDEALRRYDEVVVACLINADKQYNFSDAQRLAMVQAVVNSKKNATALFSTKDAVEVAAEVGASVLVRGIRGEQDYAYENEMADYNRAHGFDTEFVQIDGFRDVSSTQVREQLVAGDYRNIPSAALELLLSAEFASLK